jgi:hypothetical protein
MIKRHHAFLVIPLGLFLLATLYRLSPAPALIHQNADARQPSAAPSESLADDDYARHVEQVKKKLPSNEFTVIIQRPFVVIGDESAELVRQHSEHTIKWAVDKLKQEFFTKDPKDILDICCSKMRTLTRGIPWLCSARNPGRRTAITLQPTRRSS